MIIAAFEKYTIFIASHQKSLCLDLCLLFASFEVALPCWGVDSFGRLLEGGEAQITEAGIGRGWPKDRGRGLIARGHRCGSN